MLFISTQPADSSRGEHVYLTRLKGAKSVVHFVLIPPESKQDKQTLLPRHVIRRNYKLIVPLFLKAPAGAASRMISDHCVFIAFRFLNSTRAALVVDKSFFLSSLTSHVVTWNWIFISFITKKKVLHRGYCIGYWLQYWLHMSYDCIRHEIFNWFENLNQMCKAFFVCHRSFFVAKCFKQPYVRTRLFRRRNCCNLL